MEIFIFICVCYGVWWTIVNVVNICPKGSKDSGFRTCIQGTKAYVPTNASKNPFNTDFYCSKDCKDGYTEKLKVGCAHTCVKSCMSGFKRRSNAAGSAFCDAKMKTHWNPFTYPFTYM